MVFKPRAKEDGIDARHIEVRARTIMCITTIAADLNEPLILARSLRLLSQWNR